VAIIEGASEEPYAACVSRNYGAVLQVRVLYVSIFEPASIYVGSNDAAARHLYILCVATSNLHVVNIASSKLHAVEQVIVRRTPSQRAVEHHKFCRVGMLLSVVSDSLQFMEVCIANRYFVCNTVPYLERLEVGCKKLHTGQFGILNTGIDELG
jgi:hypothetical protein